MAEDKKDDKAEEKKDDKAGDKKAADGKALIAAACKAFGIAPKYIHASRIDEKTGEAVILTVGGSKVRYKAGAEVAPLSEIAVTGVNPAWAKKKVIAGKAK